jgi:hypothetical protein
MLEQQLLFVQMPSVGAKKTASAAVLRVRAFEPPRGGIVPDWPWKP